MPKFPNPVVPPPSVKAARKDRYKELLKSSCLAIAIRLFIISGEMFFYFLYNSSALFVDALASLVDVASSIFLLVTIRLAMRPPDEDHPFGHGRYEPLAGLQLGLIMVGVGGSLAFQQLTEVTQHGPQEFLHPYLWLVPLAATCLLEISYRVLMRTAKKQQSSALAADAMHYRIDSLTSLFATIALLLGRFFPEYSGLFDHSGAIAIALFMIVVGLLASRENIHQIMDRTPEPMFFQRVKNSAMQAAGVLGTEKIRIQMYGPDAHVDIDVEVDPDLSVKKAHKISQDVRVEIQKAWPQVRDVTVHIEPFYPNDH